MHRIKLIFKKLEQFGLFVSSIINYILLLIVYIVGVSLTLCLVKLAKKEMLDVCLDKKSFWKKFASNDHSLERARRMY